MSTSWPSGPVPFYAVTNLWYSMSASEKTMCVSSTKGMPLAGVLVIDRVNSNGDPTLSTKEFVSYNGLDSSNTLHNVQRGLAASIAQAHAAGAIVEVFSHGDLQLVQPETKPTMRDWIKVFRNR